MKTLTEQYKPSAAAVYNCALIRVKVNVKVNVDLYSALSWTHLTLRYGTRCQGISQFYLHTPLSSANGMHPEPSTDGSECTIPAFAFPAEAGTHLPTPEGWKAELYQCISEMSLCAHGGRI